MVPDWRSNVAPLFDGAEALLRQNSNTAEHCTQPYRPTAGSRKRKAYMPRNSGYDNSSDSQEQQLGNKKRANKAARPSPPQAATEAVAGYSTVNGVGAPLLQLAANRSSDSPPSSPAAGSWKAHSTSPQAAATVVQRCGSGSSSAAAPPAPAVPASGVAVESLATTRSRRVIKRREKFDPHMFELSGDLDDADETRSDNSSDTHPRRCYRKGESGMMSSLLELGSPLCTQSRISTRVLAKCAGCAVI